jgi:hypothetical protein
MVIDNIGLLDLASALVFAAMAAFNPPVVLLVGIIGF